MTPLIALPAAIAGAIFGSFLATLCIRWPQGRQAAAGRSSCDHCERTLGPLDLVPVASTLFTRGKCRSCGGRIDPLHFAVETAGALLAGAALLLQPNLHGAALAAFWLLLIAPAVLDTKFFWLPDRLTAVLAAAGLLLGGVATGASLADGLIGGAAGFAVLALLAAAYLRFRGRDGLGGGDPKLLGAIGLWTGWTALPFILVLASLGGLAIAAARRDKLDGRMPFGALLAGAAIAWTGLEAWRNAVGA